ncbi:MAG: TonB-dependent receptor [Novosphingobium sp.]|nr:TonB-dependent receptor [Novosphingobium sp.]
MGRFETETLALAANRAALADLNGQWIDRFHDRNGLKYIYTFQRDSLDQAAQLIPGVSAGTTGNSRNERLIYVRGFDRYQVPLSIDGIRIYLPADGRLDYGRFLTPDIAEIQVAKGYASVLDGPGAMGGAVNLVTRKPTKAFEAEARATINLDNDTDYAGYTVFGSVGTRHDTWYAQASYARNFTDHWNLSKDFKPTTNEDGGARDLSRTSDWRVNAKIGFTPNATDEYAISYTRQEGEKLAPVHVSDAASLLRYWTWPYWNLQNIYFLTTTQLSDIATLKTRLYYNTYRNSLDSFDTKALTTQTRGSSFNSAYHDKAYGGSVQLDLKPFAADRLSVAFHYRSDQHREYQESFAPTHFVEPWQTNKEATYSAAIENSLMLSPTVEFVAGFSYDWRDLSRAEDYASGAFIYYPRHNGAAWNAQGQLIWMASDAARFHASVSSRARFPTIFERFSTRFGTAASNPSLAAERATNLELGGTLDLGAVHLEGAAFYSFVDNAIVSVRLASPPAPANTNQNRNLGDARYYGVELGVTATVAPGLRVGGNYTWLHRAFSITQPVDPLQLVPGFRLTDVPAHKAFVWAEWSPASGLRIVPNIDIASDRTTITSSTSSALSPLYYRTGHYVLANLRADYDLLDNVTIGVGGRNLFDTGYVLADGYPDVGRSAFVSLRVRY